MENGDIVDENIMASSEFKYDSKTFFAHLARLNEPSTWVAYSHQPWIQADIGYQTYVSGVITQGAGEVGRDSGYAEWVSSIKLSTFSMNTTNDEEVFVKNSNGEVKVILYCQLPLQDMLWVVLQSGYIFTEDLNVINKKT